MSELTKWAGSRETSIEIAEAIRDISINSEGRTMEEVWESPTDEEFKKIKEVAFSKTAEDKLYFGSETIKR